jgi:hypothetical protein
MDASDVTIPYLAGERGVHFQGNLETLGPDVVDRRLVWAFDRLEDYLAWSGGGPADGGVLDLGTNVRIAREGLDLRSFSSIRGGGMLAPGSFHVSALTRTGPVPATLVARTGDASCDFAGPVAASLVALSGELVNAGGPSAEVRVKGNLALGRLRPEQFGAGGSVRFDADLDPTTGNGNGYDRGIRAFVADASSSWAIE